MVRVRTKKDPTDYSAVITRRLPQGVPLPPVYFHIYIGDLEMEVERGSDVSNIGREEVVLVADDVILQAGKREQLHELLNIATCCKGRRDV